ncbi:hypothetical protein [Piscibacillus halophilus]|uniref:Uncharacterized protein n=1 Tax=Piscibacillus halophilus TaxID=571933 RepID=A0A1H8Z0L9_9BACI|nr:hypothetical protein [Piscibacillus halophilus]SEP57862.1 hypothetical protein SAMN05216362_101160 [Piscibacillus halophilus]
MSWKAVELQVALPRVQDAAQIQEQLNQRGQQLQHHLVQSHLEEETAKRKQVQVTNQSEEVSEQKTSKQDNGFNHSGEDQHTRDRPDSQHPFLGQQVDYRG